MLYIIFMLPCLLYIPSGDTWQGENFDFVIQRSTKNVSTYFGVLKNDKFPIKFISCYIFIHVHVDIIQLESYNQIKYFVSYFLGTVDAAANTLCP